MTSAQAAPAADAPAIRSAGRFVARTWWIGALAVVLIFLTSILTTQTSSEDFHPANASPNGGRALAQILGRQGVDVRIATSIDDVIALAAGQELSTVLVTNVERLGESASVLATVNADVVIEGSPYAAAQLALLTDAITIDAAGSSVDIYASCEDPDAVAAGQLTSTQGSVAAAQAGVDICFPVSPGAPTGAYAVWEQNGYTWRYLADTRLFTNELLAEDGNAALGLRALGHHELLIWFVPGVMVPSIVSPGAAPMPPWFEPAVLVGLIVLLLLAIAGGGRMGRIVSEPLPVVVKPGETVIGRGLLYRRSGAVAHSAQALRAGTARRLALATGASRGAGPEELVSAVASATGRPAQQIGELLYGPPPTKSKQLTQLADTLKALESEVHRS